MVTNIIILYDMLDRQSAKSNVALGSLSVSLSVLDTLDSSAVVYTAPSAYLP